jgi:hypothetical protein
VIRYFARRIAARRQDDEGAYAILYAVLIVVMFGFSAMVVDIASVRQDRREDRVLTDNAALAAANSLSSLSAINPYQACQDAWTYLNAQWGTSVSTTSACSPYSAYNPMGASCPGTAVPYTPVAAGNDRIVEMRWPVYANDSFMTQPDLAPGSVTQAIDTTIDGDEGADPKIPCQRFGIAIRANATFGIGGGIGVNGSTTVNTSVAFNSLTGGPPKEIAALNILNPTVCDAFTVTGLGGVLVSKTTQPDGTLGPGIIAVESAGTPNCPSNKPYVIHPGNNVNQWICADGPGAGTTVHSATTSLGVTFNCNGLGVIESHALDPGGNSGQAYEPAAVTSRLAPRPTAEGGSYGWTPVTDGYGCSTQSPTICSATGVTGNLVTAYGGNGVPTTTYSAVDNTFKNATFGTLSNNLDLTTLSPPGIGRFKCSSNNPFYVPPGNWYVDCPDGGQPGFRPNDTAIFGGGTIVFSGGVQDAGTNLVFNVPLGSTAAGSITTTGVGGAVTTNPAPAGDAIVYIRGGTSSSGALSASGSYRFLAPQTMFFLQDRSSGYMSMGANGGLTMTAPKTTSCASDDTDCQTAGFKKIVLWTECSCSATTAQNLGGQGSVYLLGVFFTPKSEFEFTGQAAYASGAAQVWADTLEVKGQGTLILEPDPTNAIARPASTARLIR